MQDLIEDIEIAKEPIGYMNPEWGIPLSRLYPIIAKHFPELKAFLENKPDKLYQKKPLFNGQHLREAYERHRKLFPNSFTKEAFLTFLLEQNEEDYGTDTPNNT